MRARLPGVLVVICALAYGAAVGPAGASVASASFKAGANWTKFHFNAANTGFDPFENVINANNASSLVSLWQGVIADSTSSSPAVVNGVVYIGADDGKLYAFDATGVTNCSGIPKTCQPLWTAATGALIQSSPAVAKGVVYVGSYDGKLYAFDAAGVTNCSGIPKTCQPLWTGATGSSIGFSSPAVAGGVVYVGSADYKLYAFDAAGITNCSGSPKTCAPLWTGATGYFIESSPAVAKGVVYVGSYDGKLYAFDAAGVTNCSGIPKTCQPLWTGAATGFIVDSPAVTNGVVYAGSDKLYAFDAAGVTNCAGTPKVCTPLWTGSTGANVTSAPAVAHGMVYAGSYDGKLYAFDAAGVTNCSGSPKTCSPLWTGTPGHRCVCSVVVAGGVVYAGSGKYVNGNLYAFDGAGRRNCSGTPKTCTPLWTGPTGRNYVTSSAAVVNGVVYVGSGYDNLRVFGLP